MQDKNYSRAGLPPIILILISLNREPVQLLPYTARLGILHYLLSSTVLLANGNIRRRCVVTSNAHHSGHGQKLYTVRSRREYHLYTHCPIITSLLIIAAATRAIEFISSHTTLLHESHLLYCSARFNESFTPHCHVQSIHCRRTWCSPSLLPSFCSNPWFFASIR